MAPHTWWGLSLITLLLLTLLLVVAPRVKAQGAESNAALLPQVSGQVFTSNLTVTADESYEGDVTVMSGNVRIEDGGLIEGNLVVWSGNVEIHAGGEVEGDVTALSGNIRVAGEVDGSVAALSGNIELAESASVEGDVSVMSGSIKRAREAEIGGNIVEGPDFKIPAPFAWGEPAVPAQSDPPADPPAQPPSSVLQTRTTFLGWLGGFILRMMVAVLVTALVTVLVVVIYNVRPGLVQPLRRLMVERTAYNFVVGVIVNLVLAVITAGLIATLCLAPVGLLTGLVLVALNLVAWTATAHYVGERVAVSIRTPLQPATTLALGALLSTGLIALFWAFGGCFRMLAFLLWLLGSAPSVGALLVHTLKLDGGHPPASPPATGDPVGVTAGPTPAAPGSPVRVYPAPVSAATTREVAPAAPGETPLVPAIVSESVSSEPPVPPVVEPLAPVPAADFTVIRGIGTTFDQRLKEAGIRTFAQLAALSPAQVAAILGWTPEAVSDDDLIGQAQQLAQRA
jgi:predicted flap endonuclease-1-like 5' DNA nuclease/cytoskeletal protein CcmA (bactofilin family)